MIYLVLNNEEKGYIMKRKIPKITNSEKQILEVLWDEEKPLTSSEIVGVSDDRTWKASSVHLLLNSLLNKDLVEEADDLLNELADMVDSRRSQIRKD